MQKPEVKQQSFFDYHECRDYLQQKYGYNERDYHKTYNQDNEDWQSYMDFWHHVVDTYEVSNGTFITFEEEGLDDCKPWVREIYARYFDEFGAGEVGNRTINFYLDW